MSAPRTQLFKRRRSRAKKIDSIHLCGDSFITSVAIYNSDREIIDFKLESIAKTEPFNPGDSSGSGGAFAANPGDAPVEFYGTIALEPPLHSNSDEARAIRLTESGKCRWSQLAQTLMKDLAGVGTQGTQILEDTWQCADLKEFTITGKIPPGQKALRDVRVVP